MNKKYIFVTLSAIAVIVVVYIFFSAWRYNDSQNSNKQKIVFGLTMQSGSELAILAKEKGFFEKEGLAVEFRTYPTEKIAVDEGALKGGVDIVTSTDFPVVHAVVEKNQLKILASISTSSNINRIVARSDTGIQSIKDLNGKKVATQQNSAIHYFLHLALRDNQIKEDELNLLFMQADELPKALAAAQIDAFCMKEPHISKAKELLSDKIVILEAPGLYTQIGVLVATTDFAAKNPQEIKKVLKALLRAQEYAKKEPDNAMGVIASALGIDKKAYELIWKGLDLSVRLDQSLILLLESEARWLSSGKEDANQEIPNFLEHIKIDAMAETKPDAVTIIR